MKITTLTIVAILALEGLALAQGSPSPTPSIPGNSVPTWVFYWVLGLFTFFGGALLLVIRILWSEARKKSALSEEERNHLHQLYEWHNQKDENQIPLWYAPRAWEDLIRGLREDHAAVKVLLARLVDQSDGVNADLRQQLHDRLELHDRLQAKMLKLAVRVQQAVEALAGLERPSIESALDDEEESA